MKIQKRKKENLRKVIVSGLILSLFFLPLVVNAAVVGEEPDNYPENTQDIKDILNNVERFIYLLLTLVVVVMLVWAGITFVTAEGDPTKVTQARQRVLYAVVGIIVGIVAWGIVTVIESFMA